MATAAVVPQSSKALGEHKINNVDSLKKSPELPEDGNWLLPQQLSSDCPTDNDALIASPYLTKPHILRLSTVDVVYQLLAITLARLRTQAPNYATAPYPESFNWEELFGQYLPKFIDRQRLTIGPVWPIGSTKTLYVVYFRSTIQADINREWLTQLDRESHAEATASGGLLKYWFGSPDSERRNLATCLWRSPEDAVKGGRGPWHKQARQAAGRIYEKIEFTRLWLRLTREADRVDWKFEPVQS